MRRWLAPALLLLAAPAWAIRVEKLAGPLGARGGVVEQVEVVSEQAFVRFDVTTSSAERRAILAAVGANVVTELDTIGWSLVFLPGMPVAQVLEVLRGLPRVVEVSPNHVYRPLIAPNDPFVSSQFALANTSAFAGWEYEVGTSCRTTIAVIDTGILATHPDLSDKLTNTTDQFCDPGACKDTSQCANPTLDNAFCIAETEPPACNHGTRVAGVAAASANNATAIAGISWGAQLVSYRVFRTIDCNSDCTSAIAAGCGTDDTAIIRAIDHVRQNLQNTAAYGKMVINISLGGTGACPASVQAAVDNAVAAGIPVIAATGNDGGAVQSPARCAGVTGGSGIIPVGMTNASNTVDPRSSRGPELAANGLVAPGVSVLTTDLGDNTATASGTSFASPHVAGLAALVLSAKPTFTPAQVQAVIRGGSSNIGISTLGLDAGGLPMGESAGSGQMNVYRAMRLAVTGTLADFAGDQKAIAFPNPFRPAQSGYVTLTIPASLQGRNSKIQIFTQAGELVRELNNSSWDGKNKDGKLVASGTYIFLVSTDNGKTRGRVAVIR